jgi:hypothetical protein
MRRLQQHYSRAAKILRGLHMTMHVFILSWADDVRSFSGLTKFGAIEQMKYDCIFYPASSMIKAAEGMTQSGESFQENAHGECGVLSYHILTTPDFDL